MNIQQLESFVAAARVLNFTKAAEELYISQPALTKQLKELEKEFGCVLFLRTTRSVQLTESGKLCLEYARRILRDVEEMKDALREDIQQRFRSFSVGYVTEAHVRFVEHGLEKLNDRYPGIEIHVEKGNPPQLLEGLKKGTLDCSFLHLPTVRGVRSVHYEVILPGGLVARVPNGHRLFSRERICLKDLEGEKLVGGRTIAPACFEYLLEGLKRAETSVEFVEGNTEEAITIVTRSKKYISLTSELANPVPGFRNIPVTDMREGFDLVLARSMENDSPITRDFFDYCCS